LKAGNVIYDEFNAVKIEIPSPDDFAEPVLVVVETAEPDDIKIEDETVREEPPDPRIEAERQSAEMIAEAERMAARIVENAEAEIKKKYAAAEVLKENLFQEAKKDGYAKGYDQGYAEGTEASQKLVREAENTLNDAIDRRAKMIAGVEGEMVALINKISHKLINRAASGDDKLIIALIRQGFEDATLFGEIKIRVSKADYDLALEHAEEVARMAKSGAKIEFVKDLSLNKNDCVIETPYGNIDSSLGRQLETLKDNLYAILDDK